MVSVGDHHLELYSLLDQCNIKILDENKIVVVVVVAVVVGDRVGVGVTVAIAVT